MFGSVLREDLSSYGGASNLKFNEKIKSLQAAGEEIFHFGFGQSPFPVPAPFVNHLKETAGINSYLAVAGLPELREQIVEFHREWDGVELSSSRLVVGPGSKELIYLVMAVSRAEILLPAPAWTTYRPQARLAGHEPRLVPQTSHNNWKLRPEDLETSVKQVSQADRPLLMILTNPGNPSGCVYTRTELESIAEVCRRHKIIVLSDEIYARLTYSGSHVCMSEVYPEGTVLTSGFSKWSSAGGWRLGYAHFPASLARLREAVTSGASHTYSCAPANIQHALVFLPAVARALASDKEELRQYIMMARALLEAVAQFCHRKLAEVGVTGAPGLAGYYFMPDFSIISPSLRRAGIRTGQEMCDDMLSRAGVALMPSEAFLLSKEDLSVRFCYVIFDGGSCMAEMTRTGRKEVDETFVRKFCPDLVQGVERLCQWVNYWKTQ